MPKPGPKPGGPKVCGDKHHTGGQQGSRMAPRLLTDMRDVYADRPVRGQGRNESPGIQNLRALLKKDPEKFAARLWKMETDWDAMKARSKELRELKETGGGPVVGESPPAEEDIGEQRAIELLERLLKEEGWKKS